MLSNHYIPFQAEVSHLSLQIRLRCLRDPPKSSVSNLPQCGAVGSVLSVR